MQQDNQLIFFLQIEKIFSFLKNLLNKNYQENQHYRVYHNYYFPIDTYTFKCFFAIKPATPIIKLFHLIIYYYK